MLGATLTTVGGLSAFMAVPSLMLALLLAVPWEPQLQSAMIRDLSPTPASGDQDTPDYTRRTVTFPCNREQCEAWLYLPTTAGKPGDSFSAKHAVVVAAHGMGGQRDFGLHP